MGGWVLFLNDFKPRAPGCVGVRLQSILKLGMSVVWSLPCSLRFGALVCLGLVLVWWVRCIQAETQKPLASVQDAPCGLSETTPGSWVVTTELLPFCCIEVTYHSGRLGQSNSYAQSRS